MVAESNVVKTLLQSIVHEYRLSYVNFFLRKKAPDRDFFHMLF